MQTQAQKIPAGARLEELKHWLKHEASSSARSGYKTALSGMVLVLIGGSSFMEEIDAGRGIEEMNFLGMLPLWGSIFVVFGLLSAVRAPRFYSRLRRIAAEGSPRPMVMRIRIERDQKSTRHYADLWTEHTHRKSAPGLTFDPDIVVSLALPSWPKGRSWLEQKPEDVPVQVYGTRQRGPVIIETELGFLLPSSDLTTKYR